LLKITTGILTGEKLFREDISGYPTSIQMRDSPKRVTLTPAIKISRDLMREKAVYNHGTFLPVFIVSPGHPGKVS